jgi:methionine-rich copper-binding protein CopC
VIESVKLVYSLKLFLISPLLFLSTQCLAQALSPAAFHQAPDITGIAEKTKTSPLDDSVFATAPNEISLDFPQRVRLVKLTLRNQERGWVDIQFRYNPVAGSNFSLDLPKLEPAIYYTADWAILGLNDRLIRGSFSFAFGSGAKRPSLIKEEEDILLDQRTGDGDPTTRFVTPPRTQIIINQDPPSFDPPFTIKLDADSLPN